MKTKFLIWAMLQCVILAGTASEAKETNMNNHAAFVKMMLENDERIPKIKQSIRYDANVAAEINNGLIFADLRKNEKPSEIAKLAKDRQFGTFYEKDNDGEDSKFTFSLEIESDGIFASAHVVFFNNYESVKKDFLFSTVGSSNAPFPIWGACKKEVGTICASNINGAPDASIMFAYKNVLVKTIGFTKLSNDLTVAEALAAWVFEQLKKAPKVAILPDNIDKWEWLIIDEKSGKSGKSGSGSGGSSSFGGWDFGKSEVSDPDVRPLPIKGGGVCTRTGYWQTPALSGALGRRFFNKDQILPGGTTDYGIIIWQWDDDQNAHS